MILPPGLRCSGLKPWALTQKTWLPHRLAMIPGPFLVLPPRLKTTAVYDHDSRAVGALSDPLAHALLFLLFLLTRGPGFPLFPELRLPFLGSGVPQEHLTY